MCGTSVENEVDTFDDLQSEAAKHRFQQRIDEAVKGALAGINGDKEQSGEQHSPRKISGPALGDGENDAAEQNEYSQDADPSSDMDGDTVHADATAGAGNEAERSNNQQPQRRSGRRKPRKV
ncbi:hypothetical protein EJ03DRAFT_328693 [Teratosphaeria nubilosa]|uniref:Uncharacterized protein n=1 Tax=Teratosphaeria nubilosa TaxID=161662 RepID=A0A6G1L5U5_9PEZI|nr:hypothetical protein EJ03DRAFT_328693 [Teratosphaeria nubilosa]